MMGLRVLISVSVSEFVIPHHDVERDAADTEVAGDLGCLWKVGQFLVNPTRGCACSSF